MRKEKPALVASPIEKVEDIPLVTERRTEEIVFGMVGPIASGVSFASSILAEMLKNDYGYTGGILKVSDVINSSSELAGVQKVDPSDEHRITKLQNTGNELRKRFGERYLAEACVRQINMQRGSAGGLPAARRHFTILDSLKNPQEVAALREVYEDAFWLIGVFAPDEVRKKRLQSVGLKEPKIVEILDRDQSEGLEFGQNVRQTIEAADFYIRNDGDNDAAVRKALGRFLEILFSVGVQTPTRDELAMQTAMSIATGSACLSRQVGAAIVSKAGEIIGQGMNDVPKYGGGLYSSEAGDNDNRCWKWKSKECHNDLHKKKLLSKIQLSLAEQDVLKKDADKGIATAISKAGVKDLIEFSRSVHAEMEAIVSVARSGKVGLVGSTLYTTTFPCHNCARHIVASGIDRVIYIEPYTKSLALQLHDDAISTNEADAGKKVLFLQYEGVAPRNIIRLFSKASERKQDGKLRSTARLGATPLSKEPLDGFTTREQLVVARLGKSEENRK